MGILIVHAFGPEGYPPVVNAARAFAAAGLDVHVVGATLPEFAAMPWPSMAGVVRHPAPQWRAGRAASTAALVSQAVGLARRVRPRWVWCSDPWSLPAALPAAWTCGARLAYQEHDSPPPDPSGERWSRRAVRPLRRHALRRAELVVFPNAQRLEIARRTAGRGRGRDLVVWNVPALAELPVRKPTGAGEPLRAHFHGSISPFALPLALIDAVAEVPGVQLRIVGYSVAHDAHLASLRRRASELGVDSRVEFLGPRSRADALDAAAEADVGIAFFRPHPNNINHSHALGASNKVFDYLAAGLAVLVPEAAEWQGSIVPAFGRACDPESAASIAAVLRAFAARTPDARPLGLAGRAQVTAEWHHERAVAPVIEALTP